MFYSVPPRKHQDNTSQQTVPVPSTSLQCSYSLAPCCATPHNLNYWHKNTGTCLPQCTVSQFHGPSHGRQNSSSQRTHQDTTHLTLDPCNLHTAINCSISYSRTRTWRLRSYIRWWKVCPKLLMDPKTSSSVARSLAVLVEIWHHSEWIIKSSFRANEREQKCGALR